jgi:AcrR family transcriptional regulator
MPRNYRLGERAIGMQVTRDRIVEAAIELYTERGISGTTMRQVQVRADVAPGTLRSHFPTRHDLDRAMIERLTAEAPLPDLSIFDGARSIEERIERLIRVTGSFLDQAGRMYRMWLREPMLTDPWSTEGARYGARWSELWRAALGPLADDEEALTMLRAISEPPFLESVRGRSRSTEEACALIARVVIPWFAAKAAPRRSVGR